MLASFVKQLFGARSLDDIARARIDIWADWLNPQLARWEPSLTFEVKQHLLTLLKGALTRKDADKPALAQRIAKLRGELTVLDPARSIALLP